MPLRSACYRLGFTIDTDEGPGGKLVVGPICPTLLPPRPCLFVTVLTLPFLDIVISMNIAHSPHDAATSPSGDLSVKEKPY